MGFLSFLFLLLIRNLSATKTVSNLHTHNNCKNLCIQLNCFFFFFHIKYVRDELRPSVLTKSSSLKRVRLQIVFLSNGAQLNGRRMLLIYWEMQKCFVCSLRVIVFRCGLKMTTLSYELCHMEFNAPQAASKECKGKRNT